MNSAGPDAVPTMAFDWGSIKWFVTPDAIEGAGSTRAR